MEPAEILSRPISGDRIELTKGSQEVICISFVFILDSKIINTEAKSEWSGGVTPKAHSMWNGFQVVNQVIVSQNLCLFESLHTLFNFDINVAIRCHSVSQTISSNNIFWKIMEGNFHVFSFSHRSRKKLSLISQVIQLKEATDGITSGRNCEGGLDLLTLG